MHANESTHVHTPSFKPPHSPQPKVTECTPCTSDLRSYEIDYDDISECTEPLGDIKIRTAKGNEVSPAKMPLMRIRSVEIVFEDEMSTCTDTGILDRSIELIVSDSSDDSTKCIDDIEHLQVEKDCNDDSVTLNADDDLSDDNSVSLTKDYPQSVSTTNDDVNSVTKDDAVSQEIPQIVTPQSLLDDSTQAPSETTLPNDDTSSSLNTSEIGDSGRFTEEASSSHFEPVLVSYEDALLSQSCDVIDINKEPTVLPTYELSDILITDESTQRLYEYIDSNSDSSDNTAVCDADHTQIQNLKPLPSISTVPGDDQTVCDGSDLQYDSFVDMGKF